MVYTGIAHCTDTAHTWTYLDRLPLLQSAGTYSGKAFLCHLESNKILIENQHAVTQSFRRSHSCETQLLMFADELFHSMSKEKQIDAVIMDFYKAFDMIHIIAF